MSSRVVIVRAIIGENHSTGRTLVIIVAREIERVPKVLRWKRKGATDVTQPQRVPDWLNTKTRDVRGNYAPLPRIFAKGNTAWLDQHLPPVFRRASRIRSDQSKNTGVLERRATSKRQLCRATRKPNIYLPRGINYITVDNIFLKLNRGCLESGVETRF